MTSAQIEEFYSARPDLDAYDLETAPDGEASPYNAYLEKQAPVYLLRIAFDSNATGVRSTFPQQSLLANQFRLFAGGATPQTAYTEVTMLVTRWQDKLLTLDDTLSTVLYLRLDFTSMPLPANNTFHLVYTALPSDSGMGIQDRTDDTFMPSQTIAVTVGSLDPVVQLIDTVSLADRNETFVIFAAPVKFKTGLSWANMTFNLTEAGSGPIKGRVTVGRRPASADYMVYDPDETRTGGPVHPDTDGFSRFWILPHTGGVVASANVNLTYTAKLVLPDLVQNKAGVVATDVYMKEWRGVNTGTAMPYVPQVFGSLRLNIGEERPSRILLGDVAPSAFFRSVRSPDGYYDTIDLSFVAPVSDAQMNGFASAGTLKFVGLKMLTFSAAGDTACKIALTSAPFNISGVLPENDIVVTSVHTGQYANDNVVHLRIRPLDSRSLYRYMYGGEGFSFVPPTGMKLYRESRTTGQTVIPRALDSTEYHVFSRPAQFLPVSPRPLLKYTFNLTEGFGSYKVHFATPLEALAHLASPDPTARTLFRNERPHLGMLVLPTAEAPVYNEDLSGYETIFYRTRSPSHSLLLNKTCFDDTLAYYVNDTVNQRLPVVTVSRCRTATLTTPADPRAFSAQFPGDALNAFGLVGVTLHWSYGSIPAALSGQAARVAMDSEGCLDLINYPSLGGLYRSAVSDKRYGEPIHRFLGVYAPLERGNTTAPHPLHITKTVTSEPNATTTVTVYRVQASTPILRASVNLTANLSCNGCVINSTVLDSTNDWGIYDMNITVLITNATRAAVVGGAHNMFFAIRSGGWFDVNGFRYAPYDHIFDPEPSDDEFSTLEIAGIALGAVAIAVSLAVAAFYSLCRAKTHTKLNNQE